MFPFICVSWPLSRLLLFGLALCIESALYARDPAADLPAPPPQPVPRSLKVKRGEKIDIPLTIYGSQREELHFVIRAKPEAGTLSEPAPRGREAAVVRYAPPPDLAIVSDRFSYSTKSSVGVSAAADVKIEILDAPAALVIPPAVEFQKVLAGAAVAREVEISNSGGTISEGRVETDTPWEVEGSSLYRLKPGARQTFKVVFAPGFPGKFDGTLRFTSAPNRPAALSGEAEAAFEVSPATLKLSSAPGETSRKAGAEIVNNTGGALTISITGSGRLRTTPAVSVEAHSKARVLVETSPGDIGEISEALSLSANGYEVRLPIQGAPPGPVLHVSHNSVRFPTAKIGQSSEASIDLANIGGQPGAWKLELQPPFVTKSPECRLIPGESVSIPLYLTPSEAGRFRTVLQIGGENQNFEVLLEGNVSAGPAMPRAAQGRSVAAGRSSVEALQTPGPAEFVSSQPPGDSGEEQPAPATLGPGPLGVSGVRLLEASPTEAVFSWPISFSDAPKFRLEERLLALDEQGQLQVSWAERPSSIKREGGSVVARVRGLRPATVAAIRVLAMDAAGNTGAELFVERFMTPPPKAASPMALVLWVGGGALAALLAGKAFLRSRRIT